MIDTQRIRAKILASAMMGKLTEQLPEDGTAEDLYKRIQLEKQSLINRGMIKKGKHLEEIIDEDIPFEIPVSWKWVRVGTVAEVAGGTTPSSTEIKPSGSVPYFKVSDMNTPGNETHMIHANSFISKEYSGKIFPAGTTIFPKNGGAALTNKRRMLVVPSAVDLNTGGCTPVVPEMADWIRLYMETIDFSRMDTGSNIPTVNATNLRKQLLSLPPIGEQKRIVAKIEQALSVLDTIDELQAQYADNLTVLKGKLIDAAIQGKLTKQLPEDGTAEELYHLIRDEKQELIKAGKIKRETPLPEITSEEVPFAIPKNWKWVRWGELSNQIQYGYNAPAKDSGRIKMVRITDIQGNRVNWQNVPYCDIDEYEIGEYKLYPRDILFARTGGTVGKSYLVESVEEDSVFAGYLIRTNYSLRLNAKYMKYFMDSRLYWKQLQDGTTATAQPNCNAKTLSKMMLPLPPKDEQERIVSVLDKALQVIDT